MELIESSGFLRRIMEQDMENGVVIDENYVDNLLQILPFSVDKLLVDKFYLYEYSLSETLEIINNLNYLDHDKLTDMLIATKYFKKEKIQLNDHLSSLYDRIRQSNNFYAFVNRGNLEACKFIYETNCIKYYKISDLDIYYGLNYVLKLNKLLQRSEIVIDMNEAFLMSCARGNLEILEWLKSTDKIKFNRENNQEFFKTLCQHGDVKGAQWFYSAVCVEIKYPNDLFETVCALGYLDVAKFLYEIRNRLGFVFMNNHHLFVRVCSNKRLNVAKWLFELITITYSSSLKHLYKELCMDGIEVAKWIYGLDLFDSKTRKELFMWTCENKYYELASWIKSLNFIKNEEYMGQKFDEMYFNIHFHSDNDRN